MFALQKGNIGKNTVSNRKIPSKMEVAPRYRPLTLLTPLTQLTLMTWFKLLKWFILLTWFTMLNWFTLLTRGMRGATMGKTGLRPETPFGK